MRKNNRAKCKQESSAVRVSAKIKVSDKSGAIPDLSTNRAQASGGID